MTFRFNLVTAILKCDTQLQIELVTEEIELLIKLLYIFILVRE